MEVVINNRFFKQVRIRDGILLNIRKYEIKGVIWGVRQLKKIEPCLYHPKVDIKDERTGTTLTTKDFIFKPYNSASYYHVVDKSKEEWRYEVKTTGESFSGTRGEIKSIMRDIEDCIAEEVQLHEEAY